MPFRVATEVQDWPASTGPRRAVVSARSGGGTDAHVVLQEAPDAAAPAPARRWQLLTWSGRTDTAAEQLTDSLATHLAVVPADGLADVAFTLALGRREFEARRATVVASPADARHVLRDRHPARLLTGRIQGPPPGVVFAFPGGGAQYPGMARDLFEREPAFREAFGRCLDELSALGVTGLTAAVFPAPEGMERAADPLKNRAALALPAIFSVGYALAHTLQTWGVRPSAPSGTAWASTWRPASPGCGRCPTRSASSPPAAGCSTACPRAPC